MAINEETDPDVRLMQAIQKGDKKAFNQLMSRHLNRLHAFAQRLLGDAGEAEDVVQETFLRVWQKAGQWQPGAARVTTWLHSIAHNLCIDRLRRRKPSSGLEEAAELQSETHEQPAQQLQQHQVTQHLQMAMQKLPETQRSALLLCHYQGLSNKEAAELLSISLSALESLLARARRNLKQHLQEHVGHLLGDLE